MLPALPQLVDWLFLQKAFFGMPDFDECFLRLDEAVELLQSSESFPAESEPAQLDFNSEMHFRFPSPRPGDFPENNVVHGRLFRCTRHWQERPTVILLHGGNLMRGGNDIGKHLQPSIARRCNHAGFNALTIELPYHFQRYPRQPGALDNLNYLRMAESAVQAVAEIRALIGWLLLEGCSGIALWGTSMGGRLAGLTVCQDNRLTAAVLVTPGVCSNRLLAEHIIWPHARETVRRLRKWDEKLDSTSLNLLTRRPAIPKEKILLIEGIYDLFTPREPIEQLWQAWGRPEIWRLQHGHITKSLVTSLQTNILGWLSETFR